MYKLVIKRTDQQSITTKYYYNIIDALKQIDQIRTTAKANRNLKKFQFYLKDLKGV